MMLRPRKMGLIDLYIGLSPARNKRMEALKAKSGNRIVGIMENGKIIKNMGSEYKSMGTKINMKVDGFKTCDKEKVFILKFIKIINF